MDAKTLLTTEQFEKLQEPELGGYELDEGELVYVSPNNLKHNEACWNLATPMKELVKRNKLGLVTLDTWFELQPGVIRAPDIAFVPIERLKDIDPHHVLKVAPALVVEILSPSNTARDISRKIQQYRQAGVTAIWVLDPDQREADVYGPGALRTLGEHDVLEDQAILPGFSVRLAEVFE